MKKYVYSSRSNLNIFEIDEVPMFLGNKLVGWSGAASPVANSAEIHEHSHKNGKMSMRRVSSLVVPAGGSVSLVPGGYHLMMFGLENSLKEGEAHTITLRRSNHHTQRHIQSHWEAHHHTERHTITLRGIQTHREARRDRLRSS